MTVLTAANPTYSQGVLYGSDQHLPHIQIQTADVRTRQSDIHLEKGFKIFARASKDEGPRSSAHLPLNIEAHLVLPIEG